MVADAGFPRVGNFPDARRQHAADDMQMDDDTLPICVTCGVQYGDQAFDLQTCRICADERQYVNWDGQAWTTLRELKESGHRNALREEAPGLWGVDTEPEFAIGQRALIVPGPGGNVLWDCVPYIDDAALTAIDKLGGLDAIAISHPHYYGAMVAWSKAFGDIPIYIHEADREWVCRTGNVIFWEGDSTEILPGRTLVNCGVHFAGGTVLHWTGGAGGRGALCSGDILQVVKDRRWVSFMHSYPNLIPERPDTIRRALTLVASLPFDTIYGAWWGRTVAKDAKAALHRSAQRYFSQIGSD
ncbi:MBL fold metallo-hydrolase [Micromonospora sp. NPDC047707]|uniref:MBL fold metallo-hydrolase n=1 Tax=Micromonospora sp. NPDC047707 TaxID=3154498 RepID=UPI0034527E9B